MFANNHISTIVENQLPDFVKADHPNFVALLKKYYEYMEQPEKTLDTAKNLYDYMDVDTTRADLLKYFKSKIIPDFPEETELSQEKLIKAARYFYSKKGTGDSFKFLFRVLYNQEVDVYFPKQDVLKASDGKWQLPQALRLVFSDNLREVTGGNVNVFSVSANTINANGINFVTAGITANSYIQIGTEKRKVTNVAASSLRVEIPFANTGNTQIYDSKKLYKVTLNQYSNFNIELLEKHKGVGEVSRSTCIIEKANRTVDKDTGKEIVELFVSNVKRIFESGENLIVNYIDENGDPQTFSSKIISLISNVYLYRNRFGVVQTGRKYKTGDPVVFAGGLSDSPEAVKAVAIVNNVSTGSIEAVSVVQPGYYFRDFPNSLIQIQSTTGIGANIIIQNIWDDGGANSENFSFSTDAIVYKKDLPLNGDYDFDNVSATINLTTGAGNTTTAVNLNTATYTASSVNNYYKSFILQIVGGTGVATSPNTAKIISYNGTTKIATLNTALGLAPDSTSNVRIYANSNTEIGRALSYESITLGKIRSLFLINGGSFFEEPPVLNPISIYESDYSSDEGLMTIPSGEFSQYNKTGLPYPSIRLNSSNTAYSLANGFYTGCRLFLDVGATEHYATVVDYVVTNPGTSSNVKTVYLDRKYNNNITPTNITRFNLLMDFRPNVRGTGKIGKLFLTNGGSGYSNSDIVVFDGTGYGANANIVVGANGAISTLTLLDRGEGYYQMPSVRILSSSGANSAGSGFEYQIIGLSDGEDLQAETSDIGRIQDFKIINRGFDYLSTPNVSLKIVDILTDNLPTSAIVLSGESVWQGNTTNANSTFRAIVDDVYRVDGNSVIRIYDYNGTLNTSTPLYVYSAGGNVAVNVMVANATISFNDVYEASERKYPLYYGDGLAKANAEFLDGLIKYNGFYLTTDGFLSWDKRLQNKDYYHNFSYEIQAEKSLDDYKETIYNVAHPAGMQLLSRFKIKDVYKEQANVVPYRFFSNTSQSTNANTSYASNVVYGNSSVFLTRANVGDLIVINTTETAAEKQYTRVITNVVSNTVLWMESPIGGIGDGRLRAVSGNANVIIYGNVSAVSESIEVGDNISFNIANTEYRREVVAVTGNVVQLNTATGLAAANVLYRKTPIYNVVDYTIIRTNG